MDSIYKIQTKIQQIDIYLLAKIYNVDINENSYDRLRVLEKTLNDYVYFEDIITDDAQEYNDFVFEKKIIPHKMLFRYVDKIYPKLYSQIGIGLIITDNEYEDNTYLPIKIKSTKSKNPKTKIIRIKNHIFVRKITQNDINKRKEASFRDIVIKLLEK